MKKLLYIAVILGGTVVFTSCAKDEECVCSNTGITYTEEDAKDAGTSLSTVCATAKLGDETCEIK
ncbi:MAG: hypothetical protein COA97_06950 [Flavobacteriales bacterium]|nr:MAG: hypothetical protein COA97_06950 [Flavobacteriales bacterium]